MGRFTLSMPTSDLWTDGALASLVGQVAPLTWKVQGRDGTVDIRLFDARVVSARMDDHYLELAMEPVGYTEHELIDKEGEPWRIS